MRILDGQTEYFVVNEYREIAAFTFGSEIDVVYPERSLIHAAISLELCCEFSCSCVAKIDDSVLTSV